MSEDRRIDLSTYDSGLRFVNVVKWPGTSDDVGILSLNCHELQEAYFDARDIFKKKGQEIDFSSVQELNTEEMLQQVYRMMVDPESTTGDPKYRVFKSAAEARTKIGPDLRAWFCAQHRLFQNKRSTDLGLVFIADDDE